MVDFNPRQISKFKKNDFITYQTYRAPEYPNEDILYTWRLESTKKLRNFEYLIIPDTCIDIILEEKDGVLHNPIISRPFDEPIRINLSGMFKYWGIRFKPGKVMKYLWFGLNTIRNDFEGVSLEIESFSSLESFLENFYKFEPNLFDSKFLRFDYDPMNLLKSMLSPRHKSRLFESLTGFKINTYKKIEKFHASLDEPYLHFYDQSHFIKTFKHLTDQTPKSFFRNFSI